MTDTNPQLQEVQRLPKKINTKIYTPRHVKIKLQQIGDKDKVLKEGRGKNSPYLQMNKDNNFGRILSETIKVK